MKKILATTVAFGMLAFAGSAFATAMTWTDTIDWNPDTLLNWRNQSVSYQHDITDEGFDPLLDGNSTFDVVTDYILTVSLYDDNDNRREVVFVDQPGVSGDTTEAYKLDWVDEITGWSILGVMQLNEYGTLDVTVNRVRGDFYLDKSELVANGCDLPAPVPEPATMLLFGTGLAGLVGYSRKRSQKG